MSEPAPMDRESEESALTATGDAPPFCAPVERPALAAAAPLALGDHVGDFELVRELGKGSFGRVFLARQLSLDRLVALKVSAGPAGEARTLARLEHGHIVQVFSESTDPQRNLRLLCIQYVAGTT